MTKRRLPFYGGPLDYSFKEMNRVEDVLDEEPNSGTLKSEVKDPRKLNSVAVRLNNNNLTTLEGLEEVLAQILDDPAQLSWLDVSNNRLTTIEPILYKFTNLSVLYFHGNLIDRTRELEKLGKLELLTKVTMHNNPVDQVPNYRMHVLTACPCLRSHDLSGVTKLDRDTAMTWLRAHPKHPKEAAP